MLLIDSLGVLLVTLTVVTEKRHLFEEHRYQCSIFTAKDESFGLR